MENGAVVDQATNYGVTPLMDAASNGHGAVARFLLEKGAAVDKVDEETPFSEPRSTRAPPSRSRRAILV